MIHYGKAVKINKSCDQCRTRKVRCIAPPPKPNGRQSDPAPCLNCVNRGDHCNYSLFRRKGRITLPPALLAPSADGKLYIDRILQSGAHNAVLFDENAIVTTPDDRATSCAIAFFNNQRITSLAERLGTETLRELVETLDALVRKRVGFEESSSIGDISFHKPPSPEKVPPQTAKAFIDAFFENIHPVYPFLDQEEFNWIALGPFLDDYLRLNPPFSALYHTVLALGGHFFHGGGYVHGDGVVWGLFQVALGFFPDVIQPPLSLTKLQALTAMAVFSTSPACVQLDLTMISEAARMAYTLSYHKTASSEIGQLKAFWVIYYLEKLTTFSECTSSILSDDDIGCAIPPVPEAHFEDYNWYIFAIRLGRVSSVAYSTLFSLTASLRSKESCRAALPPVRRLLEDWRQSVPLGFRPEEPTTLDPSTASFSSKLAYLHTQYYYYNLIVALERLAIQADEDGGRAREDSKYRLMQAARTVIKLTEFVTVETFVQIYFCGIMPLSALFILFDFTIHNPTHPGTEENLVLLDRASSYFIRLESLSQGTLPGNMIREFAGIAKQYVSGLQKHRQQQRPAQSTASGIESSESQILSSTSASPSSHESPSDLSAGVSPEGSSEAPSSSSAASLVGMQSLELSESIGREHMVTLGQPSQQEYTSTDLTADFNFGWDHLNYPIPDTMHETDTVQMGQLKNLFGWVFPDWGDTTLT